MMKIFEANGTFNPTSEGLKIGDELNVVVVGGGGDGINQNGVKCTYHFKDLAEFSRGLIFSL